MRPLDQHIQKARSLLEAGSAAQAETLLRQQLQRYPAELALHAEMARILARLGRRDQALYFAEYAGGSRDTRILDAAAGALDALGEPERAMALFRRAIARDPSDAFVHNALGIRLVNTRRFEEAREAFQLAYALSPHDPIIAANLALACAETWSVDEGLDILLAARDRAPAIAVVQQGISYLSNYTDRLSREQIFAEHRRFAELTARAIPVLTDPPLRRPTPDDARRTLRVGLMSADLREHSIARFIEPILREHDRAAVHYTLYPVLAHDDPTTRRLRQWSDAWSEAALLPEPQAAAAIRREGLDILIDLSGLTRGLRAGILIARAAPVQISYLGYPNTTAMPNVDLRIVDSITDPPGAEALATERLVRLDPCFLCFAPPPAAGAIPPRAPARDGPVTFGSFNNINKITPATLTTWLAILRQTPASRLLLKSPALSYPGVRARLARALVEGGLDASRFELLAYADDLGEHYRLYHRVDIALDPFPYHGTTTTCEALYMGVPVITLEGGRHASRVGPSLLNAAGVPELIAATRDDYIAKAVALGASLQRRTAYHESLRAKLSLSPLGDAPAFARRFEAALRRIWQDRITDPGA